MTGRRASSSPARSWTTRCRAPTTCRRSRSAPTRCRPRSTRSAPKAWARPAPWGPCPRSSTRSTTRWLRSASATWTCRSPPSACGTPSRTRRRARSIHDLVQRDRALDVEGLEVRPEELVGRGLLAVAVLVAPDQKVIGAEPLELGVQGAAVVEGVKHRRIPAGTEPVADERPIREVGHLFVQKLIELVP